MRGCANLSPLEIRTPFAVGDLTLFVACAFLFCFPSFFMTDSEPQESAGNEEAPESPLQGHFYNEHLRQWYRQGAYVLDETRYLRVCIFVYLYERVLPA